MGNIISSFMNSIGYIASAPFYAISSIFRPRTAIAYSDGIRTVTITPEGLNEINSFVVANNKLLLSLVLGATALGCMSLYCYTGYRIAMLNHGRRGGEYPKGYNRAIEGGAPQQD